MIEEQHQQPVLRAPQGHNAHVVPPNQQMTIGTNDESDGIFDYYRRSVSEIGGAQGGALATNSSQNQNQPHYNGHGRTRGATSSYMSAHIYNQSAQQPATYQTSSFIQPEIQRTSALDGSAMLDATLLAEKMADGTPQQVSRLSTHHHHHHHQHVNHGAGSAAAIQHSVPVNHWAAEGSKEPLLTQPSLIKPPVSFQKHRNQNLNSKESQLSHTANSQSRQQEVAVENQRAARRLLSPEIYPTDQKLAKDQRRKARHRSSNYRPSASLNHQSQIQPQPATQSQHKIINRHPTIPSVQECMAQASSDLYSGSRRQNSSNYRQGGELAQNQLTFSSGADEHLRQQHQQQQQQLGNQALSLSLLSSNYPASVKLSQPLNASHMGKPPLQVSQNLDQTRTTRAGSELHQSGKQSMPMMSQQNALINSSNFGPADYPQQPMQYQQQPYFQAQNPQMMTAQVTEYVDIGTIQQQEHQLRLQQQHLLQLRTLQSNAKSENLTRNARYRSLDTVPHAVDGCIQPHNTIFQSETISPQQMQYHQQPQIVQRVVQTIEPRQLYAGAGDQNQQTTISDYCEHPLSVQAKGPDAVSPQLDQMTIQTGSHQIESSPPGIAHMTQLQQEKNYLMQEVVNLQGVVSNLTQQKGKLRKSKKKLRHQLDTVKQQMFNMSHASQPALDISENGLSSTGPQSNNYLVHAINDLKIKIQDIQDASASTNELNLRTLQTTIDALYKNLLANQTMNTERDIGNSQAHLMNTMFVSDMQMQHTNPHFGHTSHEHKQQYPNQSRHTLQTEEHELQAEHNLEALAPDREHLTTEDYTKGDESTTRSQKLAKAQTEYQMVRTSSPQDQDSGTHQLSATNQTSDSNTALELDVSHRIVKPFPSKASGTEHGHKTKKLCHSSTQTAQGNNRLAQSTTVENLSTKVGDIEEQNAQLRHQLAETRSQMEEQRIAKDKEAEETLQRYQEAVKKMHGRLKQVAQKFDEGEKNRQARLRKARKEIEHELGRLTEMNESLYNVCQQLQEKLAAQVEAFSEMQAENEQLIKERQRQGDHLLQLLNINKGQSALIESFKRRLEHAQQTRGTFTQELRQMRRSRSSSVQFQFSARPIDKFESGVKLQDLAATSPNPYSNQEASMPDMKEQDLHERSEERKEQSVQVLQTSNPPVSPVAQTGTEYRQSFDVDAYMNDLKTMDSQLMRRSLLEANKSTINHESHHDQQDYESEMRRELINSIPQLSPFLLGQLTQRLELQSKVLDHKLYLEKHMRERKDKSLKISTESQAEPASALGAAPIQPDSSDMVVMPQHTARLQPKSNQRTQNGPDKVMDNGHQDMKRTPTSQDARLAGIQVYKSQEGGQGKAQALVASIQNQLNRDQTSSAEGDSRGQQLSVSFRQDPQRQQQQQIHGESTKLLNEALFSSKRTSQTLKQEPMVVEACAKYASTKHFASLKPTSENQQVESGQVQKPTTASKYKSEFWNLQQLVSLDSSILTEAQQSLSSSAMREKHERMSQDFEKLQGGQEVLLTKIKDEIGSLDQEIIVLQQNLSQAITQRQQ